MADDARVAGSWLQPAVAGHLGAAYQGVTGALVGVTEDAPDSSLKGYERVICSGETGINAPFAGF
jgi:hypothetical protein